jgi:hypothetical protein
MPSSLLLVNGFVGVGPACFKVILPRIIITITSSGNQMSLFGFTVIAIAIVALLFLSIIGI